MRSVGRYALPAAAALLSGVLAGCGMPAAPLPPSLNLPSPITDLDAVRTGDRVRLTWTMPRKNTDKLLLKDNVDVRICRRQAASQACVQAGSLRLAPGVRGAFSEELPQELATGTPRTLSYFVVLRNKRGKSAGPSNAAVVLAGEAPAAVKGLEATVRKSGVVLHWQADAAGPAAGAVRLERKLLTPAAKPKATQGPLEPEPEMLDQNLLVDTGKNNSGKNGRMPDSAIDRTVRFGAIYEYRAQRVIRAEADGKQMELDGPLTAPVRVEVADVFPPAVPQGLAAVAVPAENGAAASIDLNWQPDTEPDLAGYIVYRREPGGAWQRISPAQPVVGPGFSDVHVVAGRAYEYAVTAVDQGGHESRRSVPAAETVPNP